MIALGMHNSVICSEDVPRFDTVSVDRGAVAATYLGTAFLDALPQICKKWPRGLVDPEFSQPLVSDVPTLLLSGSLDPVTPPADANRVAKNLKNSRHLVFEGAGHGQTGIACMDRVLAEFYANVDPKALNTTCLDRRMQPPFWLSVAGPSP
jgi:pimeloyl-ACP methyl ester carboxylesterase